MVFAARLPLLWVVGIALMPVAAGAQTELPRKLAAMTPEQFESGTKVLDDPRQPNVVFTTQAAFEGSRSVDDGRATDIHLRAVVDRESGATRFEIWHDIAYRGSRKDIYQVNYVAQDRMRESDLLVATHRPDDCPMVDAIGSCILGKTLAFEVPEAAVREAADKYVAGSRAPWVFRFRDRNGRDITSGIAPAEASGLLRSLEKWRGNGTVREAMP